MYNNTIVCLKQLRPSAPQYVFGDRKGFESHGPLSGPKAVTCLGGYLRYHKRIWLTQAHKKNGEKSRGSS